MERLIWKTIKLNGWDLKQVESAYLSSKDAIGKDKTFVIEKYPGGGEIETNVTWRNLRALFRFAQVPIPWKNGVLYCDRPSWEIELETET
jgi:hypothetical protein